MDGQTPNLHIFRCVTVLRGYHVYQVDWKPTLLYEITLHELNAIWRNLREFHGALSPIIRCYVT